MPRELYLGSAEEDSNVKKLIGIGMAGLVLGLGLGGVLGARHFAALSEMLMVADGVVTNVQTAGLCVDALTLLDKGDVSGARDLLREKLGNSLYTTSLAAKRDEYRTRFSTALLEQLRRERDYVVEDRKQFKRESMDVGGILAESTDVVLANYRKSAIKR